MKARLLLTLWKAGSQPGASQRITMRNSLPFYSQATFRKLHSIFNRLTKTFRAFKHKTKILSEASLACQTRWNISCNNSPRNLMSFLSFFCLYPFLLRSSFPVTCRGIHGVPKMPHICLELWFVSWVWDKDELVDWSASLFVPRESLKALSAAYTHGCIWPSGALGDLVLHFAFSARTSPKFGSDVLFQEKLAPLSYTTILQCSHKTCTFYGIIIYQNFIKPTEIRNISC